ncbi:MAG: SUMF1/EgtB/PvdO family nonheme iron enzyme [Polyangiaceae bacterium]|nr:SUMF1/EgtB/PvdO family nonheme iron enzyme [Polyangiaceae bacterium]
MAPRASGPARRRALALAALCGAAALVGAVAWIARTRAAPPARCAPGMIALGPRCCGEGQRLDRGRCAGPPLRCADGLAVTPEGCVGRRAPVRIEAGTLHVGPGDWEAQGVVDRRDVAVPAFSLDALEVTEERWTACVAAGACAPLPLRGEPGLPVTSVTADEAARFCAFAGGALPTRDQLAFAAAGARGRRYPWGDTGAVCRRAAFGLRDGPCGVGAEGPEIAGSHPDGASPDRALDLAGNVAEWTAPDAPGGSSDPTDVLGGAWSDAAAASLRSWSRRVVPAGARSPDIGFRCAYR